VNRGFWMISGQDCSSSKPLKMLNAINRMSHTYRAKDALKVFEPLGGFLPEFNRLLDALRKSGE